MSSPDSYDVLRGSDDRHRRVLDGHAAASAVVLARRCSRRQVGAAFAAAVVWHDVLLFRCSPGRRFEPCCHHDIR